MRRGLLLFFMMGAVCLTAQKFPEHPQEEEATNKGKAILLHLAFGFHQSGGDLADRFGGHGTMGGGLEFMTKNNFSIGAEGQFLFGQTVREDPLAILRTPEGEIIGNDRTPAAVLLRQRGYSLGGQIGKLFPFGVQRSGLRISLGAGWTEHWIRILDNNQTVTQLTGDYRKGYDRRTGGLYLQQFVGWQHLASNRRSNWMLGFEFNQGFTDTRREWDFNDMRKLEGSRLDLRFGIRAVWTLPFYPGQAHNIYY